MHEAGAYVCEAEACVCEAGAYVCEADAYVYEAGAHVCEAVGNMHEADAYVYEADAGLHRNYQILSGSSPTRSEFKLQFEICLGNSN